MSSETGGSGRSAIRFVLASASPARRTTLRAAGLDAEIMVSGIDEDTVRAAPAPQYAQALAREKALAVSGKVGSGVPALILGCDSVLELDGEILGKPHVPEVAVERWRRMRGRSGVLHTGHCLIDNRNGRRAEATGSTIVHFADLTDEEIEAYVATGEPLKVAGGFTVDGLGGPFIDGIEGDHHNVVGLSLPLLRRLVRELGYAWPELWKIAGGPGAA